MATKWGSQAGTPGEDDSTAFARTLDTALNTPYTPPADEPTFELPNAPPAPNQSAAASPGGYLVDLAGDMPQLAPQAPGESASISLSGPAVIGKTDHEAVAQKFKEAAKPLDAAQAALVAREDADAGKVQDFTRNSKANVDELAALHEKYLTPLLKEQERLQGVHDQAVAARDDHEQRMQGAINTMDTMAKTIAAQQPTNYWTNASLPMKLASMALAALGGATQVITGDKTNAVIDAMHNLVLQDVTLQRMRFDKNQNDYNNQKTMVGQLSQYFDRSEHAQDAAYVTAMQGITHRLDAIKPLFTTPITRQNAEIMKAQLETKLAGTYQKLTENITGQRVRIGQAAAVAEKDLEAVDAKASQVKMTLAERAAAVGVKAGQKAAEESFVGWHPKLGPDGKPGRFYGRPQDASKLRDAQTTTQKVYDAMEGLKREFGKTSLAMIPGTDAYREYNQALKNLFETARGPGFGQTGSRFTEMVKELEAGAYTPGEGAWAKATPEESRKLLSRAQMNIMNGLKDAFATHNMDPD